MRSIEPNMNVAKQRRKITQLIEESPPWHHAYLRDLLDRFDTEVAAGRPTPASHFLPQYWEEFGL
ncbi:hypothetical protein KIY79_gp73 [Mycobacterium phage Anselm]|uniref:Uncharacterized protein n=1 Tax=Mycobacterium phage Anselm TaxID=2041517 RepID=A0A2D1G5C2_9CAUD|nr:hypothetical protein KIY79_gp73 [Mycobacterium phage Anselm]ATN87071.1 hypothetical protein SEA_ANSELM_73 [Mycobacterium phage Anselm]ATN88459.1 hypothetical protein SEA_DALMATIAN_72 [Mycobacterium phage Dalmatian]